MQPKAAFTPAPRDTARRRAACALSCEW